MESHRNGTLLTNSVVDNALLPTQSTPGINDATNRLIGFSYDTSGNVIGDGVGNTFTYDPENHQLTHTRAGVTTSYVYDGEGRRVKKEISGVTTIFVYNAGSQLIAEYTTDPVPPPAGGGGTSYLTTDHLGSTRLVTDQNRNVKSRKDYCPFGEELESGIGGRTGTMGYGQADGLRQKFTQKERDAESGLDYFLARYYSAAQGRFTSVDPLNIALERQAGTDDQAEARFTEYLADPRNWNGFTYVTDNPLLYIDPDGKERYLRPLRPKPHTEADKPGGAVDKLLVGTLVVAATIAGVRNAPQIGSAILLWMARNPNTVQQIANALQEAGGGPPGAVTGLDKLPKSERALVPLIQKLASEGKSVQVLETAATRTADLLINGALRAEAKVLEGVGGVATAGTVKNAIGRGLGQSGNIIIDASNVQLTLAQAQKGARAFNADSRLKVVRIIGKDFDITIARQE